ncbi:MAG: GNAT family N-acetyltransferase [Flavobacteriia bacterium]|nr:GNAT family N-acetyltransferase [Flavobacteriia bacterium]
MDYRLGVQSDIPALKELAIRSWKQYQNKLTEENWSKLLETLTNEHTYLDLLNNSNCIVCLSDQKEIIGMAFIVSKGNPTELYDKDWAYIRFVTVHPVFNGLGIGQKLTEKCITFAKKNNEQIIALHTSEIMNAARHIYESLGFTILKEIEPRLGVRYWIYTLII